MSSYSTTDTSSWEIMTPLLGWSRTREISWRRSVAFVENAIRKELNAMQKAKGVASIYKDIGKAFVKNSDIHFTLHITLYYP
jgi:hypothetical protein